METEGLYCLKVSLLLAVFWGIYYFCLRGETFYRFNRLFLLTGVVAALLVPLVTVHFPVEVITPEYPKTSTVGTVAPLLRDAVAQGFDGGSAESISSGSFFWDWLWLLYGAGVCALLVYRVVGLFRLWGIIRRQGYRNTEQYNLVESPDLDTSFSFCRFIFLSRSLSDREGKELVIRHEMAHITQRHWMDLFLMDGLCVIGWFSPVIWMYARAIRENHEFLADRSVLDSYPRANYQATLVNQWLKAPVFPMTNSFCYSNQLKRITMMKKQVSNPIKKLFSLFMLPTVGVFLWAFAEPEYVEARTAMQEMKVVPETNFREVDPNIPVVIPEAVKDTITRPQPVVNREMESPDKKIGEGVEDRTDKPLLIVDGEQTDKQIEDLSPDDIFSITVNKEPGLVDTYGKRAARGVILVTTKSGHSTYLEKSGVDMEGTVKDESGKPIPAASVLILGSPIGTITDLDGNFKLRVAPDDWVNVSAIGYIPERIVCSPVSLRKEYPVTLRELRKGVIIGRHALENFPEEDHLKLKRFLVMTLRELVPEPGMLELDFLIDTNGDFHLNDLTIVKGEKSLDQKVREALKQFPKLSPPTLNGVPIQVHFSKEGVFLKNPPVPGLPKADTVFVIGQSF